MSNDGLDDDLMAAARFLMVDGAEIDPEEALRIGMRLCRMAGMAEVLRGESSRARGTK